jgi:predicted AlkP superfamily phosphohydrolase/phosphomutase
MSRTESRLASDDAEDPRCRIRDVGRRRRPSPLLVAILMTALPFLAAIALYGCEDSRDGDAKRAGVPKVVLVGIDAADWKVVNQLFASGDLVHLQKIARAGAFGSLGSITWKPRGGPALQWTTMATGRWPDEHGVLVDYVSRPDERGYRGPVQSGSRRVRAIWNVLGEQGIQVGVSGWPATWPAERVNGRMASHFQKFRSMTFDYEKTVRRSLQLTNTGSIYADRGLNQTHPRSFHDEIGPIIAAAEATEDVEMLRTFPSLENASRRVFFDLKWNFVANEIGLGIATRLLEDPSLSFVTFVQHGIDAAFHRAHRVVTAEPFVLEPDPQTPELMKEYYAYIDGSLGEVLASIGDDAIVIVASEHGTSGGRHAKLAIDGILAVAGAGVRRGLRIENALLMDLFPTILYIYDLPIPRDVDGRVLTELFTEEFQRTRSIRFIDTYEDPGRPLLPAEDFGPFDAEIAKRLRRIGYPKDP